MWEPMLTLRKRPGVVTNTYFSDFFDHYCGNNDPDNWEKAIRGNREKCVCDQNFFIRAATTMNLLAEVLVEVRETD